MLIKSINLEKHLDKKIFFISSDEIELINQNIKKILNRYQNQKNKIHHLFIHNKDFDFNEIFNLISNNSLFNDFYVIKIIMNDLKPNDKGKFFSSISKMEFNNAIIIIQTPKLDKLSQNTNWFKDLTNSKNSICTIIYPLKNNEIEIWAKEQIDQNKQKINEDAFKLLLALTEGNLLSLSQEIQKFSLLNVKIIDLNTVKTQSINYNKFTIFILLEEIFLQNHKKAIYIFNYLMNERTEISKILLMILKDLRFLYDLHFLCKSYSIEKSLDILKIPNFGNKRKYIKKSFKLIKKNDYHKIFSYCLNVDMQIKGIIKKNPQDSLFILLSVLSGATSINYLNA